MAMEKKPVFYVEDQALNIMLMQAIFERRPNLSLVVAMDGQQAREAAATLPQPALILVDLRLPDCHGAELLPQLRRQSGWADAPAIAVTAEPHYEIADTGFGELWTKPLDIGKTLRRLDQLLGESEAD